MAETNTNTGANDGANTNQAAGDNKSGNEFTPIATQEELNRVIGERIARERSKYAGFEDLKAKAEKLDAMEEASRTELEKATKRAQELEAKLSAKEQEDKIRVLRSEAEKKHGLLPGSIIGASTPEDIEALALKFSEYAKSAGSPIIKSDTGGSSGAKGSDLKSALDRLLG
ncbi:hypothetical protein LQZ18_18285 [Lachnospiraceae bacterium ZAX-1]